MADERERGHEIVLPGTGELVPANDPAALGSALAYVRQAQENLRAVGEELTEAIVGIASVSGTKTLALDDGTKLTVKGGTVTAYDAEAVETELREAGMPEERIREIVVETVTSTVKAVELKRAAGVNDAYRQIMERHATRAAKRPYVEIAAPPPSRASPAKLTKEVDR
jgi:hypothetical protein